MIPGEAVLLFQREQDIYEISLSFLLILHIMLVSCVGIDELVKEVMPSLLQLLGLVATHHLGEGIQQLC